MQSSLVYGTGLGSFLIILLIWLAISDPPSVAVAPRCPCLRDAPSFFVIGKWCASATLSSSLRGLGSSHFHESMIFHWLS